MTTRDERLLALKSAVVTWADKEIDRLEAETRYLESVRDRAESSQLSSSNTGAASELTQNEIDEFLVE